MITAFKQSKPDRLRTHCLKQDKRMKKRILFVNFWWKLRSQINICSYCIWKIYCHLGHKNGGRYTTGRTRPQNNMFEKNKTSTQRTLQQSNTTHCMSFTTWTAHKWCLPSQTMISIPSLMWRPRGTIKRFARETHTRIQGLIWRLTRILVINITLTHRQHNAQWPDVDLVLLLLKWTYIMLWSNTRLAVKPSKFDHDEITYTRVTTPLRKMKKWKLWHIRSNNQLTEM